MGSLSLLQGIFPMQGWNPRLPHCWRILYQLTYEGSPDESFLIKEAVLQPILPSSALFCLFVFFSNEKFEV